MKKLKFLALMLLAGTMAFTFNACGDDDEDNDDNGVENTVDRGLSEFENNKDKKEIHFYYNNVDYYYYYNDNEMITSSKTIMDYFSTTTAKMYVENYSDSESGSKIEQKGSCVIITQEYLEEEATTVDGIKLIYENFKK